MSIINVPTANGSNRTNTSNQFTSNRGATSLTINQVIPANAGVPISVSGSFFYVTVATATIDIRPGGGAFNPYTPGTGLNVGAGNEFGLLEVKNNNAFPVAFQLFVGFDGFIDNRVIIATGGAQPVGYPTYSVQSSASTINIVDLSGQPFADINGGLWYAVNRISLTVCNADTGVSLLLQKASATSSSDASIAFIQPNTSYREQLVGNFRIRSGGSINAIVNEIYSAIPRFA